MTTMTLEQVWHWHAACMTTYEHSGESALADQHRALAEAIRPYLDLAHLAQPAQAVDYTGRSAKDYAIEHAGYLATAVRKFLHDLGEENAALDQHESNATDDTLAELEAAQEAVSESRGSVRDLLYEFEKRRDYALSGEKAGPGDGWRPIETAPKDGSFFLAADFSDMAHEMLQYEIVRYKPGLFPEYKEAGDGLYRVEMVRIYEWEANNFHAMTHWHRIPASPTPTKETP